MSALVLADAFSPAEVAEMRVLQQVRMHSIVCEARALALRDQAQWIAAIDSMTPVQKTALTHAVMHGDHCEGGRTLREVLQMIVLDKATQRAKDELAKRFGVDYDMDVAP